MLKFSRNGASLLAKAFGVGRIVIKWGLVAVAKSSKASCYKSIPMKRPLYAALDLHSAYSVLGSMDHSGKTQAADAFCDRSGETSGAGKCTQTKAPAGASDDGGGSAHAL